MPRCASIVVPPTKSPAEGGRERGTTRLGLSCSWLVTEMLWLQKAELCPGEGHETVRGQCERDAGFRQAQTASTNCAHSSAGSRASGGGTSTPDEAKPLAEATSLLRGITAQIALYMGTWPNITKSLLDSSAWNKKM